MPDLRIIQGGMGVAVSGWPLAKAVAQRGQLGVVSGTGLAIVLARRLQLGDLDGHIRRALAHFPVPAVAQRILDRYYIPGGKAPAAPFELTPMPQQQFSEAFLELTVLANFTEVFLAKEGHRGLVGINYLEKVQTPTLASLFGAMLAGVDYVLMGAGIPRFIPGVLDAFAQGLSAELRLDVEGSLPGEQFSIQFDPARFCGGIAPALRRPVFLAIISSVVLAQTLARKSNGRVDGFIIEGHTAGGHNAPPRGTLQLNAAGEPTYGARDEVDLEKIRELGLPFWLAGGYGQPEKLSQALALGAAGIQVGTPFAFCDESGISSELKQQAMALSLSGQTSVFTDPVASPTGFPLKVLQVTGSLSEAIHYDARQRLCDIGFLRHLYRRPDGSVGYRCPAEPIDIYVQKGGDPANTAGRKCLCNALFVTVSLGQTQPDGTIELPLVTAGNDAAHIARYLLAGKSTYSAAEVIDYLLREAV